MQFRVQYHYHSGFSVQLDKTLLIFDYWEGEGRKLEAPYRITEETLKGFEKIYVFVSHDHPDHFDSVIYDWAKPGIPIQYLVSGDFMKGTKGRRMEPGSSKQMDENILVRAFPSTDAGVSWLVEACGVNIFHAGDLNLWHWRDESTLREIEIAESRFDACLETLDGIPMDLVMFPVDPRQGNMYDTGAIQFILRLKPRLFIPMHWQEREDIPLAFAKNARTPSTTILPMIRPGCSADIRIDAEFADVRLNDPQRDFHSFPAMDIHNPEKQLEGSAKPSPFTDTDLPVDFS